MKSKIDTIKQYFKKNGKKELFAVVSVAAIIFFTIIFSTIVLIMRAGKVKVEIRVAPRNASLTLNDVSVKNNKTMYLEPGKYHLIAKRDHFEDLEVDFQVSKELPYVVAVMSPSDEEGDKYLDENPSEFRKVEGYIGVLMEKAGALEREKYPIIKYLPDNNRFYSISYSYPNYEGSTSDNGAPLIRVKTDTSYLDAAVAKMKTFEGVSLIDYEINFDLDNPFKNSSNSHSSDAATFLKETYRNSGYTLSSVEYLADDYAVGIFTIKDRYSLLPSAKHLALIQKEGNSWKAVSTPEPLLTKFNTPDVSEDILNAANSYTGL